MRSGSRVFSGAGVAGSLGAFACSVATGVIFGFMPARKAAALDPVAALTSE